MKTTFILIPLNIKSSYKEDKELPLKDPNDVPDTLQCIITHDVTLRIRTFSIDHDIRIHRLRSSNTDFIRLATQNSIKHYGDVIDIQHIVTFENFPIENEADLKLKGIGLPGEFKSLMHSYIYWSPDGEDYYTQSEPE